MIDDLISRRALFERTATLEAQALDYVGKLIERDGEETSVEWRIWSAILTERTAFKHDVYDAPSAQPDPQECEKCIFKPFKQFQPERKKGKWIIVTDSRGRHAECPYCGEWKYHSKQKFCGECGAEMEGEEE